MSAVRIKSRLFAKRMLRGSCAAALVFGSMQAGAQDVQIGPSGAQLNPRGYGVPTPAAAVTQQQNSNLQGGVGRAGANAAGGINSNAQVTPGYRGLQIQGQTNTQGQLNTQGGLNGRTQVNGQVQGNSQLNTQGQTYQGQTYQGQTYQSPGAQGQLGQQYGQVSGQAHGQAGMPADRPALGIRLSSNVQADGVQISQVVPNSPAQQAGLQVGDTIVSINDQPVRDVQAIIQSVSGWTEDRELPITIRRNGEEQQVNATLKAHNQIFAQHGAQSGSQMGGMHSQSMHTQSGTMMHSNIGGQQQPYSAARPNVQGAEETEMLRQRVRELEQQLQQLQSQGNGANSDRANKNAGDSATQEESERSSSEVKPSSGESDTPPAKPEATTSPENR